MQPTTLFFFPGNSSASADMSLPGHERAMQLIPEAFFWDAHDELAPFGSDEGKAALREYMDWKQQHPLQTNADCIKWLIETVGEMRWSQYNRTLLQPERIKLQIEDIHFDDQRYIYTTDITVIAAGFAQLVVEGFIEGDCKPFIALALERQNLWASLQPLWPYAAEYRHNLAILQRALINS